MKTLHCLVISLYIVHGKLPNDEKKELCKNLECDETEDAKVCGIRYEENAIRLRLFDNECKLIKFGCQVDNSKTFGLISMKYCNSTENENSIYQIDSVKECPDCSEFPKEPVCGIRPDGKGFRVRTFESKCELIKYNCDVGGNFTITDYFICSNNPNAVANEETNNKDKDYANITDIDDYLKNNSNILDNIIVVHKPMSQGMDINKSIADFFASTHKSGIPLRRVNVKFDERARKKMIKNAGAAVVFRSKYYKPDKVEEGWWYMPTLRSCYHRCPTKCPETYMPVCGSITQKAREPAIMFQNHCFMDAAQCKWYYEDPERGNASSGYVASAVIFCMGERAIVIQFVPLIKTLQYLGRLKKSKTFRHRIRNFGHLGELKFMG